MSPAQLSMRPDAPEHIYWMRRALELASKAESIDEVPVGAIIVSGGEIIGQGWNQPVSSHDPTAHAEIIALRDACRRRVNYRLPDTTMYVTIEPCAMCAGALVHARVAAVVYGASEPKAGMLRSHIGLFDQDFINTRIDYLGGVLDEECGLILSRFFQSKRRQSDV